MRLLIVSLFLIIASGSCYAQQSWSLEECLQYAHDHNIAIKQADISANMAKNIKTQSVLNLLPSLSATSGYNFNFGNSIDPTTYEFVRESTQSNTYGLTASVPLFTGGQQVNNIKKSQFDLEAARSNLLATKENVSLTVIAYFLNVLLAKEVEQSAQQQLQISQKQLEQTNELISAGMLPSTNRFDLEAQLATLELNLANASNALDMAKLNLQLLLQLSPSPTFDIEVPSVSMSTTAILARFNPEEIYQSALQTRAGIQTFKWQLRSAEKSLAIARGATLPTISAFGNVNTSYFSNAQTAVGIDNISFPVIGTVEGSGEDVISQTPTGDILFDDIPYETQLEDNLRQTVGLSLNVPIFSGWSRRTAVNNAKLQVENASLQLESASNDLRRSIYQAYQDALAAEKSLKAAEKAQVAREKAYEQAQQKYDLGAINGLELSTAQDNLAIAEIDLIQAKYQFVFKIRVLEHYRDSSINP